MKMTTGILGCALAAGLMTLATGNAQAGVNIDNTLYSPMKLKITVLYQDGEKTKKASITSKDVLNELGYNNNVQLASAENEDIWVINKDVLVSNLTSSDILYADYDWYTYTEKNNKYSENGIVDIGFDSNQSDDYFYVSGIYSYSENEGSVNNNGEYNYSNSMNAKNLTGYGYFEELSSWSATVTGSASFKGGDKFQALSK